MKAKYKFKSLSLSSPTSISRYLQQYRFQIVEGWFRQDEQKQYPPYRVLLFITLRGFKRSNIFYLPLDKDDMSAAHHIQSSQLKKLKAILKVQKSTQ